MWVGSSAEQPVEHERRRSPDRRRRCAAGRARRRGRRAAGRTRPRGTGAASCTLSRPSSASTPTPSGRRATSPTEPARSADLARILRRPPRRIACRGRAMPSATYSSAKWREKRVRDRLDLAAQLSVIARRVVAEALVERPLEPLSAVGVREQAVDPGAERRHERAGGVRPPGRHGASVAGPRPAGVANGGTPGPALKRCGAVRRRTARRACARTGAAPRGSCGRRRRSTRATGRAPRSGTRSAA